MTGRKCENAKWMRRLQSGRGASLAMALLAFLFCAVVGSVVLVAGTASPGRLTEIQESDQTYYAVTSAAQLFKDAAESVEVVLEERTVSRRVEQRTITSAEASGGAPDGEGAVWSDYEGAPGGEAEDAPATTAARYLVRYDENGARTEEILIGESWDGAGASLFELAAVHTLQNQSRGSEMVPLAGSTYVLSVNGSDADKDLGALAVNVRMDETCTYTRIGEGSGVAAMGSSIGFSFDQRESAQDGAAAAGPLFALKLGCAATVVPVSSVHEETEYRVEGESTAQTKTQYKITTTETITTYRFRWIAGDITRY